ncbi:MAG: hypothetical protein HYZ26_08715 [Chloroflexi bacterium]|nr:hypothetical protein [Chloroflexota bacterium]
MGVIKSTSWSIQGRDGNHVVAARLDANNWTGAVTLTVTVDGMPAVEISRKVMGDHSLRVGPHHVGLLKVKKGWPKLKLELYVDAKLIPEGQHTVVAEYAPPSQPSAAPQVIYAQPPPQVVVNQAPAQSGGSTPVMPILPPKCPNCGAPISMETVQWTGPMAARCPSCNNGIEVEWRKIGG